MVGRAYRPLTTAWPDAPVPAGDGQATCGTPEVPLKAAAFRP